MTYSVQLTRGTKIKGNSHPCRKRRLLGRKGKADVEIKENWRTFSKWLEMGHVGHLHRKSQGEPWQVWGLSWLPFSHLFPCSVLVLYSPCSPKVQQLIDKTTRGPWVDADFHHCAFLLHQSGWRQLWVEIECPKNNKKNNNNPVIKKEYNAMPWSCNPYSSCHRAPPDYWEWVVPSFVFSPSLPLHPSLASEDAGPGHLTPNPSSHIG